MEINDDDSIKPSHVEDKDTMLYRNIITLIHPINLMKYQTHMDIRRLTPNSLEL